MIIFTHNLAFFYIYDFPYAVFPKLKLLSHNACILRDFWYTVPHSLSQLTLPSASRESLPLHYHVYLRFITDDLTIVWP